MNWAAIVITVLVLLAALNGLVLWLDHQRVMLVSRQNWADERRKHVNNVQLSEELEVKLKDVEDLKAKVNLLLLKNGLRPS